MGDWPQLTVPPGGGGGLGVLELVYAYTVAGADKASIDTGVDTADAGSLDWTNGDVLEILCLLRTDDTTAAPTVKGTVNNDVATSNANYDTQYLYGSNTSVAANRTLAGDFWLIGATGGGAAANFAAENKITIQAYEKPTFYKTGILESVQNDTTAGNNFTEIESLTWHSTSAITRFAVTPVTAGKKFKIGSQILVYKRKRKADGWTALGATLTYSSADGPTFVATTSIDLTGVIPLGARIKLNQTTDKYFIVTAISSTTITLYGGTDYTLANAAITVPQYSMLKAPLGFPLDPTKWTVEVTDTTDAGQNSPVQNTWYNALSISLPIGAWRVYYQGGLQGTRSSGTCSTYSTLSTANNSESDKKFTSTVFCASVSNLFIGIHNEGAITVAAKTSYYLNVRTDTTSMTRVAFRGDIYTTVIRAVCAYL